MGLIQLFFLAISLSIDSLVVSLTSGAIIKNHKIINVLKIASALAIIQMLFTVLGWVIGATFASYIEQYDHWVAFSILIFLGVKVIYESLNSDEDKSPFNPLDPKVMFTLAVATSIDALAVGLTFSLINKPILPSAVTIGLVTFFMASLGVIFGCKVGKRSNLKINLIGGIILILIGTNILFDHTIGSSL